MVNRILPHDVTLSHRQSVVEVACLRAWWLWMLCNRPRVRGVGVVQFVSFYLCPPRDQYIFSFRVSVSHPCWIPLAGCL